MRRGSTRRTVRGAIALGLVVACVASCGGDDDAAEPETSAGPVAPTGAVDSEPVGTSTATTERAPVETVGTVAVGQEGDSGGPTRTGWVRDIASDPSVNSRPADWNPDGELRIGYGGPPRQLDPAAELGLVYLRPIYDSLTELGPDGQVRPRLATGWSYPDATTMVLTLREGVSFQDGTPFDAEAVRVNLERYKTLPTSVQASSLSAIDTIEVIDDHTVQLNLSSGGAELPVMFSQGGGMMVSPKAIAETPDAIATEGAGASGAYVLESFTAGESASYVPNPNFWDLRKGLLARLTIVGVTDTAQRINALEAGDLEMAQIFGAPVAEAQAQLAAGELQGLAVDLDGLQYGMMLRDTLPPFDNPLVREAVAYAIDKEGFSQALYDGACNPAAQFFPAGHWAHAPELEGTYAYDPDRARELIAESGVTDLKVTMRTIAVYTAASEVFQAMLEAVGFDVTLEVVDRPTEFGEGTAHLTAMAVGNTYEASQLAASYAVGAYHLVGDDVARMEELISIGNDPAGSVETWQPAFAEIWAALYGGFRIIPACNAQHVWAHDGSVANIDDLLYTTSGSIDVSYLYVRA